MHRYRELLTVSVVTLCVGVVSSVPSTTGCGTMQNQQTPVHTDPDTIASEMRRVMDDEFAAWYPRSVDTLCGGFFSDMDYRWNVDGTQEKFVVTQARHVWAASHAARFYGQDSTLRRLAAHGVAYLRGTMWDSRWGGFYNIVTREGEPVQEDGRIVKRAYGNAFAIYGLAEYVATTGDTAALHLAQETFRWLEAHSHDPLHGGYHQFLDRNGTPLEAGWRREPPKDQNSTIHLLEAFTRLYEIWPDATVRRRLEELLHLVRDVITTPRGYMVLFFQRDWTPVSFASSSVAERAQNYEFDHVSFGHDVETAYLMLEASAALGLRNDSTTLTVAQHMVDHALIHGWDTVHGGLFDGGYYESGQNSPSIVRSTKEWWCQAEALNAFLLMSDCFPDLSAQYYDKFCAQWEYCKKYVIDFEHGGWYWGGLDGAPQNTHVPKASIWKCNYHTSRALINCIGRLRARVSGHATR
jgi:cellobiose epimerase